MTEPDDDKAVSASTAATEPEESVATSSTETTTKGPKKIALNVEFGSFLALRGAIERYQRENSVQLIVKDSKLLKAESTRKIIPKVYHMVNQNLMYHSITYCCKCHGELKQKPGTRIKNVGQKRLNCPMYIRFKLSPDLQKLVLFDIDETHNHGIDPTTFQMTPRQQVYKLSRMRHSKRTLEDEDDESSGDISYSLTPSVKSESDVVYAPPQKSARLGTRAERNSSSKDLNDDDDVENDTANDSDDTSSNLDEHLDRPDSPLDSDSSCSDSDEEELRRERALLPFPIRLIGSAIQSSPELLAATKQLIEIQKSKLLLEKHKLSLETKQLELMNSKLELEVRTMEKNLAAEMAESSQGRDTTIYVQAS